MSACLKSYYKLSYCHIAGCECNATGSVGEQCMAEGGQCECLPHVILQDCSQCQVNHYNFSSGQGCTRKLLFFMNEVNFAKKIV